MREIKFRGISPHSGTFFYGDFVEHFPNTPRIVAENLSTPIKIETLGQFTGLKDKNGIEIYEGDITKSGYTIMWNNEKCLFAEHIFQPILDRYVIMSYPIDASWIEIIGNIHQNQELLK